MIPRVVDKSEYVILAQKYNLGQWKQTGKFSVGQNQALISTVRTILWAVYNYSATFMEPEGDAVFTKNRHWTLPCAISHLHILFLQDFI